MSASILPFAAPGQRRAKLAAIRGSVNARAAFLQVSDETRKKWLVHAICLFDEGASTAWAISEAVRGMTAEHKRGAE